MLSVVRAEQPFSAQGGSGGAGPIVRGVLPGQVSDVFKRTIDAVYALVLMLMMKLCGLLLYELRSNLENPCANNSPTRSGRRANLISGA